MRTGAGADVPKSGRSGYPPCPPLCAPATQAGRSRSGSRSRATVGTSPFSGQNPSLARASATERPSAHGSTAPELPLGHNPHEPRQDVVRRWTSGPHGIGSAARMTAVRRYEGTVYDSSRWDGFELRPGDIYQHAAEVWDDVDADDLHAAHLAGTGAAAPVGHAIAVDRHGDPRPHGGVRRPGGPDAPQVHQDPHAARRDPQRSDGHVHLRRARPRTWRCRWITTSTTWTSRVPRGPRAGGSDRRHRAQTVAATAATPDGEGTASGTGSTTRRRRHRLGRRCGAPSSTCRRSVN